MSDRAERNLKRITAVHAQRRAAKQCVRCGAPLDSASVQLCLTHVLERREQQRANRALKKRRQRWVAQRFDDKETK